MQVFIENYLDEGWTTSFPTHHLYKNICSLIFFTRGVFVHLFSVCLYAVLNTRYEGTTLHHPYFKKARELIITPGGLTRY